MTLRIVQDAQYQGQARWTWSVWLEGPADELDGVEAVTYVLHSTFVNPIRTISDRSTNFRLDSSGWGEFEMKLEIRRRSGRPLVRRHRLVLEYPPDEPLPLKMSARGSSRSAPVRAAAKAPLKRPYSVFISHTALDRPLVNELAEHLEAGDVNVFDDSDVDPGLPFKVGIEQAMASADATVVILSDFDSELLSNEVEAARGMGMPVLPVVIGGRVPTGLAGDVAAFRVDAPGDMSYVAGRITEHLRSMG